MYTFQVTANSRGSSSHLQQFVSQSLTIALTLHSLIDSLQRDADGILTIRSKSALHSLMLGHHTSAPMSGHCIAVPHTV